MAITGSLFFLPTVSPSDCYVTLWLPTASSHQLQTRMVKNSRNPIWNQSFHFRIHSQLKVGGRWPWPCSLSRSTHGPLFPVPPLSCSPLTLFLFQNVVQLKVFDQDFLTKDDPMLSVLFDVGTLRAGESRRESFSLNPQARLCVGQRRASALGRGCFEGWPGTWLPSPVSGPGFLVSQRPLSAKSCSPSKSSPGVPVAAQQVTNLTSIQEDMGLIPGFSQWLKDLAWLWCRLVATASI